ncbi:hypothetical protein B1218_25045, partial [Pseudomonas ogarae]
MAVCLRMIGIHKLAQSCVADTPRLHLLERLPPVPGCCHDRVSPSKEPLHAYRNCIPLSLSGLVAVQPARRPGAVDDRVDPGAQPGPDRRRTQRHSRHGAFVLH